MKHNNYFICCLLFLFISSTKVQSQGSGNTLLFNGSNQYVSGTNSGLNLITNTFTIELWLKPATTIVLQSEATSGASGTGGQSFAVYPLNLSTSGISSAGVSAGTNGIQVFEHGPGYLPPLLSYAGAIIGWTHVAIVYTAKQPKLYVNGILVRTGLTSTQTVCPHIWLAGNYYGYFKGNIDEFRIWNYARTETQIRDAMCKKLIGTEVGLMRYYNFDETSGTVLNDLSSHENGTLNSIGGSSWTSSGAPIGNASTSLYSPATWAGQTLTLPAASNGTTFSVTTVAPVSGATAPAGVQLYQVDAVPNFTTGITGLGNNNVYYGVFVIGGTSPTYSGIIDFTAYNPTANVKLFYRANNSVTNWSPGPLVSALPFTISQTGVSTQREFILGTDNNLNPLPIELISFDAKINNDKVDLKWATASEKDNDHFTIEKSKDGINFIKLSEVTAAGNNSTLIEYSQTDADPYKGISYYRLTQTDRDGITIRFDPVSVKFTSNKNTSLFPNPVINGELFLQINGFAKHHFILRLYNMEGKEYYSKEIVTETDNEILELNLAKQLPAGIYALTLRDDYETKVIKLVVNKL